jgi:MraZ protein
VAIFLSTTLNRIDKKGRVSLPAPFRTALLSQGSGDFVLFRSAKSNAIEGFPLSKMTELSARLDNFDMFDENQDDLATTIFAESIQLSFDSDGRFTLPQHLIDAANLEGEAAFVGLGSKFQIWHPRALEEHKTSARKNVKSKNLTLPKIAEDRS